MANLKTWGGVGAGVIIGLAISVTLAANADSATRRTIAYAGYVDFDGQPVNAGAVALDFAIFPCPTPGTAAGQCLPLWVSRGSWTGGAAGWPSVSGVAVSVFAGRFAVELGADGQNALPAVVFEGSDALYLAMRIEGRALATLQKLRPASTAYVADLAHEAEHAGVADQVGDLTPELIASRRAWTSQATVAPGAALELATYGDASDAEVLVWERDGARWSLVDPSGGLLADPSLIAWYPFDETSGVIAHDVSGHGHDLGLGRSATLGAAGVQGGSIDFGAGSGQQRRRYGVHRLARAALPNGDLTVSMWLRPRENSRDIHILSLDESGPGNSVLISIYPPSCEGARMSIRGSIPSVYCGDSMLSNNRWVHAVIVFESNKQVTRLYLDGALEHTGRAPPNLAGRTFQYLLLGAYWDAPLYDYIGSVDELMLWSRALSDDEITELYRHPGQGRIAVAKDASGVVAVTNQTPGPRTLRALVVK
ncbi:MAG: LamG domain-containing protein [Myxococcota bacterium]